MSVRESWHELQTERRRQFSNICSPWPCVWLLMALHSGNGAGVNVNVEMNACVCECVCAAEGQPVLHPRSCSSLSARVAPSLKAGESRLAPQDRHKPAASPLRSLPRSFPRTDALARWFTGPIARQPELRETRSGLLSIRSLIALVYELLRFNWTELKVLRFHLPNKSRCVISVMQFFPDIVHQVCILQITSLRALFINYRTCRDRRRVKGMCIDCRHRWE